MLGLGLGWASGHKKMGSNLKAGSGGRTHVDAGVDAGAAGDGSHEPHRVRALEVPGLRIKAERGRGRVKPLGEERGPDRASEALARVVGS